MSVCECFSVLASAYTNLTQYMIVQANIQQQRHSLRQMSRSPPSFTALVPDSLSFLCCYPMLTSACLRSCNHAWRSSWGAGGALELGLPHPLQMSLPAACPSPSEPTAAETEPAMRSLPYLPPITAWRSLIHLFPIPNGNSWNLKLWYYPFVCYAPFSILSIPFSFF